MIFFQICNIIVDIIFILDILVGFLTAYTDKYTGAKICSPVKIAKRYLKSTFIIDLLASLYFISHLFLKHIFADATLTAISLLRLIKLVKLTIIIDKLGKSVSKQTFYKLLKVILFLLIYVHIQACYFRTILYESDSYVYY